MDRLFHFFKDEFGRQLPCSVELLQNPLRAEHTALRIHRFRQPVRVHEDSGARLHFYLILVILQPFHGAEYRVVMIRVQDIF